VTVGSAGTITAGNVGILARSAQGAIGITNSGQITAPIGVAAGSTSGAVTVMNSGNIGGATVGVAAGSTTGVVTVTNDTMGQITFGKFGLAAASGGAVTITNNGILTQNTALPNTITQAQINSLPDQYRVISPTDSSTAGVFAIAGTSLVINNAGTIDAPSGTAINTTQSRAGAQITNAGTINGAVSLNAGSSFTNTQTGRFNTSGTSTFGGGSFSNAGTVTLDAATFTDVASFSNVAGATLSATNSSLDTQVLTNTGTINANGGAFNGAIANNGGSFNVAGAVSSNSTFGNAAGAALNVNSGTYTVAGLITNAGTANVLAGATLQANSGFANATGGTLTNAGTLNGGLTNTGTYTQTAGVTNGGTTNTGIINANGGTFNGAIANNGGSFNASGSTNFGDAAFSNDAQARVNLASGAALNNLGSFINNGTVALIGTTSPTTASITLGTSTNPGTFTNAGAINLQNGTAPGNTLTINGNYLGQNGVVNGTFSSQTGAADQLVIAGNASGTTAVNVTNIGNAVPFTTGASIVRVTGTAPQGTFNLGQLQNFGTVQVQLVGQSAEGGNSFTISPVAAPNALAQSGATASTAARTLAFQGSTVILDRVTQLRQEKQSAQSGGQPSIPGLMQYTGMNQYAALISKDPIAPQLVQPAPAPVSNVRGAVFARAFGDFEHRSGSSSFTVNGATFRNDLSYNQSSGGVIGGADVVISGLTSPDDAVILGTFGGYTVASVQLAKNVGHQFYEGGSVGAYATYLNGGFFADTLFKADLLGLDITGPNVRQNTGLQNYSFLGNIGYRFNLANALYIEPTAGLEYVITNFNSTPVASTTTVPLQDGDALRGRIGARLGTEFTENNIRIEPSITGLVYDVFSESGTTATFGSVTGVSGLKNVGKVRGEVQASVNFFNLDTGWAGFLRADYRVGGDLVGAGGRAGVRYQW